MEEFPIVSPVITFPESPENIGHHTTFRARHLEHLHQALALFAQRKIVLESPLNIRGQAMAEIQPYLNYILAALAVLAALVVLMIIFRMFKSRARGRKGMRLGLIEYCEIDQSRRLVLVRRDDVEHLLMIGGGHDLVVESGIGTGLQEEPTHRAHSLPLQDVIPIRPPRAPVFGSKRPSLRPVDALPPEDDQTPA
jgi:hypothetical protein